MFSMFSCLQNKYKESGKKSQNVSLYSQLTDTNDIQFAKTVSDIQSEVRLVGSSHVKIFFVTFLNS